MQAHSETAEVRGKLSEQEQLVAELRHTAATAAAAAERVPELEALLATQQRAGKAKIPCILPDLLVGGDAEKLPVPQQDTYSGM